MGELKRAQELRVDEFSIQKLRESHETIQRVTSQVQELQERMNYLNDSGEFQEVDRVEFLWNNFTRSQPTSRDSKSAIYAKLRQTLAT